MLYMDKNRTPCEGFKPNSEITYSGVKNIFYLGNYNCGELYTVYNNYIPFILRCIL